MYRILWFSVSSVISWQLCVKFGSFFLNDKMNAAEAKTSFM